MSDEQNQQTFNQGFHALQSDELLYLLDISNMKSGTSTRKHLESPEQARDLQADFGIVHHRPSVYGNKIIKVDQAI